MNANRITGIFIALLCITPADFVEAQPRTNSVTVLGARDAQFIINDERAFLLGISYYAGLGAPEDFIRRDLDDLQRHRFNWKIPVGLGTVALIV